MELHRNSGSFLKSFDYFLFNETPIKISRRIHSILAWVKWGIYTLFLFTNRYNSLLASFCTWSQFVHWWTPSPKAKYMHHRATRTCTYTWVKNSSHDIYTLYKVKLPLIQEEWEWQGGAKILVRRRHLYHWLTVRGKTRKIDWITLNQVCKVCLILETHRS